MNYLNSCFQMIPNLGLMESDQYNGVFHARFWHFGEWFDIYVDDLIPVYNDERYCKLSYKCYYEMWPVPGLMGSWIKHTMSCVSFLVNR